MSNPIRTERDGAILVITIDRPEVRNAMNGPAARALSDALDTMDADPSIFVSVLTGAGGWFSAGADLKAAAADGTSGSTTERGAMGMCTRPPSKPLIAAVEGGAFGGGFEMLLACDLVVAAGDARFGLPEARHNLVAVGGGLLRLPRKLPANIAAEIALTGAQYPAEFLHRHGLINRLVPPGQALPEALALARSLLANGPTALAATAAILREVAGRIDEIEWTRQRALATPALESADRREGAKAFVEKRPPEWRGR